MTQPDTGRLDIYRHVYSHHLNNERSIFVFRPPGYDEEPDRRYPLLLMQDGQKIWSSAASVPPGWRIDEAADALIAAGEIAPLVIAGIANTDNRSDEYVPEAVGRPGRRDMAALYGRFIVEDVVPFLNHRYRLLSGPENTFVGGSSYGALISTDLGLLYPGIFGALVLESPSIRRGLIAAIRALNGHRPWRVWHEVGTHEFLEQQDVTERYQSTNRELRDAFLSQGWQPGQDYHYAEIVGGHHDEDSWANRMPEMLRWLVPADDSQPEPPSVELVVNEI